MLHVDKQYVFNLSPYLRNFKIVSDTSWRFSCGYCGDSIKDPRKTRGNIYLKNHKYQFKCFNCGTSKSFKDFIKDTNMELYQSYQLDNYKAGSSVRPNFDLFGTK